MTTLKEVEEWLMENHATVETGIDKFTVYAGGTHATFKHLSTAINKIEKELAPPPMEEEGQQSLFNPGKDLIDKDGSPILF
jgi:hypothetical protein